MRRSSEYATGSSGKLAASGCAILADSSIEVIAQSRESFLAGLDLYESRPDKLYSLTDCISMAAMRSRGISDVLTFDHHFAQEGFRAVFRA